MRRRGWVGSPQYEALVAILIAEREKAGLTQRDLAERLNTDQSRIARIESRQRNVSVLEFFEIAKAMGSDPQELFGRVARELSQ